MNRTRRPISRLPSVSCGIAIALSPDVSLDFDGQRPTVLIVDDEPLICRMLVALVGTEGYEAAATEDARVAVDLLVNAPPPRVVVLDLMMPRMSGIEALHEIRRQPRNERVAVIVYSAATHTDVIDDAIRAGADAGVTKGAGWDPLWDVMKGYLGEIPPSTLSAEGVR